VAVPEVRGDDFVKTGPYVAPTYEDDGTVFQCTREYCKGKGKYPVEFTVAVPEGWEIFDTANKPSRNLIQFIKLNEKRGELKCFSIGHFQHNPPSYNPDMDLNKQLMKDLMPQLASKFRVQFHAKGIKVKQKDVGFTTIGGKHAYRIDMSLTGWVNAASPKKPYYLTMICMPRLDHKPHGVLFLIMSLEDETIRSCDDLTAKGVLGKTLASFQFVN
jgi:hypothetical protein